MNTGVYEISFKNERATYIGSAVNLRKRKNNHLSDLRLGKHGNINIQHVYDRLGEDSFIFTILEVCNSNELISKEQYYIDLLQPDLNILRNAGSWIGHTHRDDTKKLMSMKAKMRDKSTLNISGLSIGREVTKKKVKVTHNNKTTIYNSLTEAWKALGYRATPGGPSRKLISTGAYMSEIKKYKMELVKWQT